MEQANTERFRSFLHETGKTLRLLARNRTGLLGALLILAIALLSLIGPLFVPPDREAHVSEIYQSPSPRHLLGTDFQGQDILNQVIHGGRDILIIAVAAGLLTTAIAVTIGSLSAFLGGYMDTLLMELANIWLTIPQFPLLVVLATIVKLNNVWLLALLLAILGWPGFARQVRSQVLSLKKRDYVEAAQLLNLGTGHIIFREMLPNMAPFIAISLILSMTRAIYQQTGLIFLGLVPFSGTNWAVMLQLAFARGALYQAQAAWSVIVPAGAIAVFQIGLVWFSRSLEEIFNPRLRTGV